MAGLDGHDEFHFHDGHAAEPVEPAGSEDIGWALDNVVLTTVGIDIGSATSHVMFARLHLQRLANELSSRFVVVERDVIHRSTILLTPYRGDGLIDAPALGTFISSAYADAGLAREQIDTGAVILTGVALLRENAGEVAALFADEGGRFVCASAGHGLEALLAAHGSGAVASSFGGGTVLNIDIGGGTTKLALARDGEVLAVSAIATGARLLTFDEQGRVTRIESAAVAHASAIGVTPRLGHALATADRAALAERMADSIVLAVRGETLAPELQLLPPLPAGVRPDRVSISGGVSEYLAGRTDVDYGDLARELSASLKSAAARLPAPLQPAGEGIRATVVGASQYTVQLSGNTIHVSDDALLPLRNLPVVGVRVSGEEPTAQAVRAAVQAGLERADLAAGGGVAYGLRWTGAPRYASLRAIADGLARYAPAGRPLVVAIESDIAATLGRILIEECGVTDGVVVVDGLDLGELDYIDIGERVMPAGVVPVVVKSLVFGAARPRQAIGPMV